VRVLLVAVVALLLGMAGLSSAGASPAAGPAPAVVHAGELSGVFVSSAYQAAHPDYVRHLTSASTGSNGHRPVMNPDSHYGCAQAVCIDVVGSGTHVTQWSTDVVGNYGCIKAFFDMRHGQNSAYNTVWGPEICSNGQSGTYITYYNDVPTDFPNGDQLCNGWIRGVVGYACATIIA
jgi:hypothetical protein